MSVVDRKLPANTEDNSVTSTDVGSRTTAEMPNAAAANASSMRRTSVQRKPLIHRSTPNITAASQADDESTRPTVDAGAGSGARSTSPRRRAAAAPAATSDANSRRAAPGGTPRSVTSRDVAVSKATTTTPVRRPTTPTSSVTAASSRQPPAAAPLSQTTSKKLCRSTGNLATTSPPPRRRMSTNSPAIAVPMAVGRHQRSSDAKPVVISGRGSRAQTAAARDVGAKSSAQMRSRIGIAPDLLLPNCYQPGGKTTRSLSVDDSALIPTTPAAAAAPVAVVTATPPRIRRSLSAQEPQTSPPPLQPTIAFDSYPEPPPEDKELNSRMEMLFEEYRKVERGLIFTDERITCSVNNDAAGKCSTTPLPTYTSLKSSGGGSAAEKVSAGSKRVGQTIGSARAKSVGNLSLGSTTTAKKKEPTSMMSPVPSQQQRTVRATAASTTSDGRPITTTHQRGQSSPGLGRRRAPPPATPPPSRKVEVPGHGVTAGRPRQLAQRGKVAAAPVADLARQAPAGLQRARWCGGSTRDRRDSLPTSLQDASRHLRNVSAAAAVNNRPARVDAATAATPQSRRRSSTPNCVQRATPRSAVELAPRADSRAGGGREAASAGRSRQLAAAAVSDTRGSASDDRLATVRSHQVGVTERQSRPSTPGAGVRSMIPRPVSCSGRTSTRLEDQDARKPDSFEQVLRRFDSGVDVAAGVELSPSDDGSLEAAVQRLSDSLESCTQALLANNNRSPPEPTAGNGVVDFNDDEYY